MIGFDVGGLGKCQQPNKHFLKNLRKWNLRNSNPGSGFPRYTTKMTKFYAAFSYRRSEAVRPRQNCGEARMRIEKARIRGKDHDAVVKRSVVVVVKTMPLW